MIFPAGETKRQEIPALLSQKFTRKKTIVKNP